MYVEKLMMASPAQYQGNHAQKCAANQERHQTKNGADAKPHLDMWPAGVLHLHQMFKNPGRMHQQVQQLRACSEAEQHKHGISDITGRRGVASFFTRKGFRQGKVSHIDLRYV